VQKAEGEQQPADEREQGKERDAEAGRSGRPDRRRRLSRRRQRRGHQEQSAAEHPRRSARMPADRPPADGGSGARGQRATHKRRGPAPHLAKPGVQPGAESDGASGGLGVPRALPLARGMSKPVASGENAWTRDDGSGGPVTARSGGTTDHAAERNAGSGQAGSVTPPAARSLPDADGVERSGAG